MKILYVIIDGKVSGGNHICAALLRAAKKSGYEVELLAPSRGPLTDQLEQEGVKIHFLKLDRSFHVHKSFWLAHLLRKWNIDLVHAHTSLNPEILLRFACRLTRVPIICHQHEGTDAYHVHPFIGRYQRWLDRVSSKFVTRFIAVCHHRSLAMIQKRKYPADQVTVIYNGVNIDSFHAHPREMVRQKLGIRARQIAIGLIGRLEPQKGHDTLLDAIPAVLKRFPQTKFFLIGDDHRPNQPFLKRYQNRIRDLKISENCFLLGFQNNVSNLIQGLDIVTLPSWWEGHPLSILEAMAARKPVIASRVGGIPEIIDHEETGLLIPARDSQSLADAICDLIENPDRAKKLAFQGHQKVREQFDQERMVDQVLLLYEKISTSSLRSNIPGKAEAISDLDYFISLRPPRNDDQSAQKLAVVTEIISPYRIPVFNRIAEVLGKNFKVFFMSATCRGRQWEIPYSKIQFDYEILKGVDLSFSNRPNPRYLNFGVTKALRKFWPDAIVIGGYHHFTSYLVRRYAKFRRTRLFLWCESTASDNPFRNPLIEKIKENFIRSCDGYLVPGMASEDYLRSYGVNSGFFHAPNTIDTELFQSRCDKIEPNLENERRKFRNQHHLPEFVVLFVGRLSPEKNIPTTLQVVQNLQKKGAQVGLVIVGDGPCRKQCETLSSRLQLRHVVFTGFKQQEELPYYYAMSDVLILPSYSEPWGLVVNEALTCGLPVLSSDQVGCAQDLILEGKTGYLCSRIQDYEGRIFELYHHPGQLELMRQYCREYISSFSPEHCAQGFINLVHREPCAIPTLS